MPRLSGTVKVVPATVARVSTAPASDCSSNSYERLAAFVNWPVAPEIVSVGFCVGTVSLLIGETSPGGPTFSVVPSGAALAVPVGVQA